MINKILCYLGLHAWSASLDDYIEEFGSIPLDSRICKKSKCDNCGKAYDTKEQTNEN